MERVIVSGAGGFIGRYVTAALLDRGYQVIALTHERKLEENTDSSVICGDICDHNFVSDIADKVKACDAVIHLAADLSMLAEEEVIRTNCIGTLHMIELSNMLSVKSFIFMSSIPVIGIPESIPVTEKHPVCPKTLYHITKYAGEQMVESLCKKDIQTMIVRIPSPIGSGMDRKNFLSVLLDRCMAQEPVEIYGTGNRVQNYIDVRDIACFIADVLSKRIHGTYLIAGSRSVSNLELAYLCLKLTGSVSAVNLGKRQDPEDDARWIISCEKAKQEAGFTPRHTLEQTIRWIIKERVKL